MKMTARSDCPLLRQFRRWAKGLMRVNPRYVRNPRRLRDYIRGPNWDDTDPEYAHYRLTVAAYGEDLLGLFERMRADGDAGLEEYRGLLRRAGITEET